MIQNVLEFDIINSTNDFLKVNYKNLPNLTIVRANYQTKGRGQFKRVWEANYKENLLFSILIKNQLSILMDKINSIVVNSIINILNKFNIKCIFKYPNDILVGDKKICGILIETKYNKNDLEYIIVGIGLNINQEVFETKQAISLKNIVGKNIDIKYVFNMLIRQLLTDLRREI